jgi:hypothetical protein
MFEKKIKYEDFNGLEREETFTFHISKAEMARKEMTTEGGYADYLRRIIDEKDSSKIYKIFEEFIDLSYGEKTPDGKRFVKKDADGKPLVEKFKSSAAYDEFIIWLFDFNNAIEFMKNVFPKDVTKEIKEEDLRKEIEAKLN